MRSSVNAAQQRFDGIRDEIPGGLIDLYQAELERASSAALALAERVSGDRLSTAREMSEAIDNELYAIEDALKALLGNGQSGLIGPGDFYRSLELLRQRREQVTQRLGQMNTAVDTVDRIDDDPARFADDIFERMPAVAPEFSF